MNHYNAGDFQGYLRDIFDHTGTDAGQLLNDWLNNLGSEETGQTNLEKATRLGQFTDGLIKELEKERKTDKALVANPGGIKLDHIAIEHHGNLTTDLIGNKAFEDMLLKAQGLYGVIVGITPIASLSNFIQ